jgi:hypothetical protein
MFFGPGTTLYDLERAFEARFPYLRVVSYTGPDKLQPVDLTYVLVALGSADTQINLDPDQTVQDFIQQLERKFGLYSLILRKSGRLFLETTVTDFWTLNRQNQEGAELSFEL